MSTENEQDAPSSPPRWHAWAFVLLIVVASFVVYQHGLAGGFTNWDDNWLITENPHIRGVNWRNLQTMFNPMAPREELGNEYLPVRDLSYALNYSLDGLNPRGYHATNLLLHIFNALLVMLLAMRLTGRAFIGGLAGLVFAVQPVHVEAVSWLSSRKDLLAAFFLLASVHLYLASRRSREGLLPSQSAIVRVGRDLRLSYGLALLCFVLALLSKMPAVVLPALLVLIELFCGHALRGASLPRRLAWTAPFWAVAALFTALAMKIGTGLMREPYGDGLFQSTLTALSAITRDLQVMVFGLPLHAAVDMPVQTGLSLPVVAGALIIFALLAAGVWGWRQGRGGWNHRVPMLWGLCGLCALWFIVALAPVSNFAVQIGTVFAERYLYIPSIGLAVALAALAGIAAEKISGWPRFAPLVLLLAACGLWSWQTAQAVKPWRNSTSLWTHALAHDPANHTAHFNLAREKQENALLESDDTRRATLFADALAGYQAALHNPARTYRYDRARVLGAMASVELQRDNAERALELLDQAESVVEEPWRSRANPGHVERLRDIEAILANYRGLALSALDRHDEAVVAFEQSIARSARYASARLNLASQLGRRALQGDAIDESLLERAWAQIAEYERARGRDEAAIEQRARLKYAEFSRRLDLSGRAGEAAVPADFAPLLAEARALYTELIVRRAGAHAPRRARARTLVEAAEVMARGRAGDATAEAYFKQALELDPGYVGLRTMLAYLLFERGGKSKVEANQFLAEELRIHPDHLPAKQLKAAGMRQTAVDQAAMLNQRWTPDWQAARKSQQPPTWQALITTFYSRDEFRRQLLAAVALLRDAIEADPANAEGHAILEGTGVQLARGMWFTHDPHMRRNAEELMRTGFNARPEDEGPVAQMLTAMYLQLAEEVINPRKPPTTEAEQVELREALNELLENMLSLSEQARRVFSNRLFRVGRDVASGAQKVRNAEGEATELSELAREAMASEFMLGATMLNPDNVPALDWLKAYYQKEGRLDDAVKVFEQMLKALKDKPQLLHGVQMSLAQLQHDLAQQMLDAFRHKLKMDEEAAAADLRARALNAYRECLETTGRLLENSEGNQFIDRVVRMRGIVAQRLAYLQINDAEQYYTIALEAYARLPLDFTTEIADVRRKRARVTRDPYARLREFELSLRDAPVDADTSILKAEIAELRRRIARTEAENLLREGQPERALERLAPEMLSPNPSLLALRGEIREAMAAKSEGEQRKTQLLHAARDYEAAVTEPEALLRAARLYWEDEALMLLAGRITSARLCLRRVELLLIDTLELPPEDATARERLKRWETEMTRLRREMTDLGSRRLRDARELQNSGRLQDALELATEAVQMLGDHGPAYQRLGLIQRDLGRRETDADAARRWFQDARASFSTALGQDIALVTVRVEIMLDMAELLVAHVNDAGTARLWLSRAREAIDNADEQVRPDIERIHGPRLAALEKLAQR